VSGPQDRSGPGQPGRTPAPPPAERLAETARVVAGRVRRLAEPSGATRPHRRLPVTPADTAARARRIPGALQARAFPLAAPTWPDSMTRPPAKSHVGRDFETDWARRVPARVARLLINEGVTRPLMAAIAAPDVQGLDRIEQLHGPAIFAPNHTSHVDTPLLLSVIPERWRNRLVVAGAADYFFDTRTKGAFFALVLGAVPIERRRIDRGSVARLANLLDDGWSLIIYPEGGRSPDGWGQPHTAGAGWLAARTGRPLVPVHIAGTRAILPRGATHLRPGRATVTFGRPLRGGPDEARTLADRLERAIEALADEEATDWWTATKRAARRTSPPLTGPGAASAWRRAWSAGSARRGGSGDRRWPRR